MAVLSIFGRAWDFFQLTEPHLGISYGAIYLGLFVVAMSARYLVPILGIGGKAVDDVNIHAVSRIYRYKASTHRNREMQYRKRNHKGDEVE